LNQTLGIKIGIFDKNILRIWDWLNLAGIPNFNLKPLTVQSSSGRMHRSEAFAILTAQPACLVLAAMIGGHNNPRKGEFIAGLY
jgi:hypothetical protein